MGTENTELSLEDKIMNIDKEFEAQETTPSESNSPEEKTSEETTPEEPKIETLESDSSPEEGKTEEAPKEEYVPNLTYRVHDKEHTFNEQVASYIKSKEDEDFFRELVTKAEGIEVIKPKLEKYREEATSYRDKISEYEGQIKERDSRWEYFNNLVNQGTKGDSESLHNLLDALNIPDHVIGEVVAQRLEMSPTERKARTDIAAAQYQQSQVESQKDKFQSSLNELERIKAEFEFEKSLTAASDLSPVINFIDSSLGEGTFKKEVINIGIELEEAAEKNKQPAPTHRQVFEIVANKYKQFMPAQASAAPTGVSQPTATEIQKRTVVKGQGALPNLGTGSVESPSGKSFLSIADLEKERDAHFGRKMG